MADLLIELLSEEVPARMQSRAANEFATSLEKGLKSAELTPKAVEVFHTPRRLVVHVTGVPARQSNRTEEKRGPRVGAPEQAVAGFLKANGLDSLNQCEQRETAKGAFWFVVSEIAGRGASEVLPEILLSAITQLSWPKSMRWSENQFRWVRPLQGLLAIFDGSPLSVELDLKGGKLISGDSTVGHRFVGGKIEGVPDWTAYRAALKAQHVILDPAERKALIRAGIEQLAAAEGYQFQADERLLDEVTGLVEWPHVLLGTIDEVFLDVAPEALVTSMKSHQKYFPLNHKDGSLAPRFALVANMPADAARDETVVAGNERVLKARLSDAKFFWDLDLKTPMADRIPELAGITFYKGLGSMADKASRLESLAAHVATVVPDCDHVVAAWAARLAKADLVSGMVGEFPELQGIMGAHYAARQDEKPEVASAIRDHYKPQGPGDAVPMEPVAVAVALADKLDTLAGFFAIGETPTGSRDPFALRRAALGVIRIVLENQGQLAIGGPEGRLRLRGLLANALAGYSAPVTSEAESTVSTLMAFFNDRLRVHYRDQGRRHDVLAAVFGADPDEDDFIRLERRVDAVTDLLTGDDGQNLLVGYRRAANILQIEEQKDGRTYRDAPDAAALQQPAEAASLRDALDSAAEGLDGLLAADEFSAAAAKLASLRGPIDRFFDEVTVNAEEVVAREARLKLLGRIVETMNLVADFSEIEG